MLVNAKFTFPFDNYWLELPEVSTLVVVCIFLFSRFPLPTLSAHNEI